MCENIGQITALTCRDRSADLRLNIPDVNNTFVTKVSIKEAITSLERKIVKIATQSHSPECPG